MKLPPISYRRAGSADEAVALLAESGDDAAVLAGGQSLLLELRYGDVRRGVLVDLAGAADLAGLAVADGELRLGALVRHAAVERLELDDPLARLLRRAAAYVAHPPIRARGTFAGSLAWAHPAAEWCALARALDARMTVRGPAGEREVAAEDWFRGPHRTQRAPDEVLTAVTLPLLGAGAGVGFAELRRTSGSFALAAAGCAVHVAAGRVTRARIGLANAAGVPVRAAEAEAALVGSDGSPDAVRAAADAAAAAADPASEPHCSAEYRRHALGVLTARALTEALGEAA
ncbi:FAD binding domain-containing protein [Geodermatophilus nigrescens]|uniref:Carbon-monoxide dehydrogenase medium subunit n=1 Tax=Geodermatophilus nigrescens TaxID=1070870 RepID=A0A1M5IJT6_9ACTN|nr:FAD binding domain-containing protein [Geodermatophilus nigrescens]SHG28598.1 carbon-monoxide dehydrogenase medium subunit [Geodermatophilus nigrescens]